jgi:transposase
VTKERKKFTKEFKEQAVKMALADGASKASVSRKLGISDSVLYRWIELATYEGAEAFRGNGKISPFETEVRKLRQENKELRLETEFLKKSAIYFASLKK